MNHSPAATPTRLAALALSASLAVPLTVTLSGCSTIEGFFSSDKGDGKTITTAKPLEVPPDLTQLSRESRYQPQGGVISASGVQAAAGSGPASTSTTTAAAAGSVAPNPLGDLRVERQGQQRWLVSPQTPEQLWPQLKAFWEQRGATLVVDDPKTGILETDWAESRDKAPKDLIRSALGQLFSNVFDSGFRDRYRMRVERTANGSEVYVSHRGLEEVYTSERKEATVWRGRPNDPQLEAEVLAGLMVSLGTKPEAAKATVAAAPEVPAKVAAPVLAAAAAAGDANQATSLVVDDPFDRAWRRVGLALDRGGFTVEDRDRGAGLYYVRYIDPKSVDKDEPSWWSKFWGDGKDPKAALRYRILLKAAGDKTNLTVQTTAGAPDTGENAKRIIGLLTAGLK